MEASVGHGTVRYIKRLVTALTLTTVVGLVVLVSVVVMRFSQTSPQTVTLPLPDQITLPDGVTAEAVTMGKGWVAVVSGDAILVFEADGTLRKRVDLR